MFKENIAVWIIVYMIIIKKLDISPTYNVSYKIYPKSCIHLVFGMRVYSDELQINVGIRSGWMLFGQLATVGLWNLL
jgi:hypothetical protein